MAILGTVGTYVYRTELLSAAANEAPNYAGAIMVFQQTAAPTGWTKSTADNDAILTVTTSTLTTGGLNGFSTSFNSTVSATGAITLGSVTIGSTSLTATMVPNHTHTYTGYGVGAGRLAPASPPGTGVKRQNAGDPIAPGPTTPFTAPYTGPTAHTHPNPPSLTTGSSTYFSTNFNLKYADVIIATKV
jgi:hypothetical protein